MEKRVYSIEAEGLWIQFWMGDHNPKRGAIFVLWNLTCGENRTIGRAEILVKAHSAFLAGLGQVLWIGKAKDILTRMFLQTDSIQK